MLPANVNFRFQPCEDLERGTEAPWESQDAMALHYLCYLTLDTRGCSSLCSMERGVLFVPFASTSTRLTRAFSVVGPSVWNGLPMALRLLHRVNSDALYSSLKTALFSHVRVGSASE